MTINSFVSISLKPPLIGFFLSQEADLYTHMKVGTKAALSILSQDQRNISDQFAGLNQHDIVIEFESIKNYHIIKNALGWYKFQVNKTIELGDHLMIVAEVLDLDRDLEKKPLIYYSGYKAIDNKVEL